MMKKVTKGIFVLALCMLVWQGVNMAGNGGNKKAVVYGGLSKEELDCGRKRSFSFYADRGKTNDICYISYHTEVRRGGGRSREVTVMRIIGK